MVFSGKMIYNRVSVYLYGDTIEISEAKIVKKNSPAEQIKLNETADQKNEVKTDTSPINQQITPEAQKQNHTLKSQKIKIKYQNKKAKKVKINASFFGWKEKDMKKVNAGEWEYEVFIKDPGEYRYFFIVDGNKVLDPKANKTKDGKYSILEVK